MATVVSMKPGDTNIPSPEVLIKRARAMIPTLKARARQCTLEGKVPDETVREMHEAGFWRILQPKRWGGYEMHPNVFFAVQKLLAEGCMSTGWILGVLGCHPYELALFDNRAQQDVWGEDNSILVSSTYQPVGKVEHADGGFYLSGHWGFSSGSEHCSWVLLGAMVPPKNAGDPPDMRTFLLPRKDYKIEKNWDVFGLQGTGSHDIIVERAFVPEYRTHKSVDGFLCKNPGQAENTAPLYTLPWAQVFVRSVSSAAFGGARAAVNAAVEIMKSRISTNTGKAAKNDPILHAAIADAHTQISEMERTLEDTMNNLMARAEKGESIPLDARALYAYQSSRVVTRLSDLVDELLPLLGGRAIYFSSPIIQPWLDLKAARAHVANDPNNRSGDVVNILTGQEPTFLFM